MDGLTGFPEAINAVFPKTKIQLCIVHLVRNSLRYAPHKDMKAVERDLKSIYRAVTLDQAENALLLFGEIGMQNTQLLVVLGIGIGRIFLRYFLILKKFVKSFTPPMRLNH